jgi:hypothetical protein
LTELQRVLSLQREAFRYGARSQLEACAADLRTWAAAYAAKAADSQGNGQPWKQVAREVAAFARDWIAEADLTR